MTRHIAPLLLVAVCACGPAATLPTPTTTAAPTAVEPTTDPPPTVAPADRAGLWTVLPYLVGDGMEYGPSQVVIDENGKRRFARIAGVVAKPGVSQLVRVIDNGPMPSRYEGAQDFVWPKWKVAEVIRERREDPNIDWTAPVLSASLERTARCLEVTLQVFESHTFCAELEGVGHDAKGALVFAAPDFYPFPAKGGPIAISVVPELGPMHFE